MRRGAVILLLVVVACAPALAQKAFPPITANDRIIVVAPHPDDEILGAGGLIQQACAVGAEVHDLPLTPTRILAAIAAGTASDKGS